MIDPFRFASASPPEDEAPAIVSGPVISSTGDLANPHPGDVLSVSSITVTGHPDPTLSYTWYAAEGGGISGVSSDPTFAITSDEIGKEVWCQVVATNGIGSPASAESNHSGVVASESPAPPETSWTNPLSTGDRRSLITLTLSASLATFIGTAGPAERLIDGSFGTSFYFSPPKTVDGDMWIEFDFGASSYRVTGFRWYQSSGAQTQGVWEMILSDDGGSTWNVVGSSFTLGGHSGSGDPDEHSWPSSVLQGKKMRLRGVSGSTSDGPYCIGVELQISA